MTPPADAPKPWTPPSPRPGPLETDRFILRCPEHSDAEALLECMEDDRASYAPWLPWIHTDNRSLPECHYSIEMFKRKWDAADDLSLGFVMSVIDKQTGTLIAGTGLHRFRPALHEGEIGYWVRSSARGKGIATEATAHLLSWAFRPQAEGGWGLRRITIWCAEPNAGSVRVPTKLGLPLESRVRQERWLEGLGWTDSLGWAVLESDWDRERHQMKPH